MFQESPLAATLPAANVGRTGRLRKSNTVEFMPGLASQTLSVKESLWGKP